MTFRTKLTLVSFSFGVLTYGVLAGIVLAGFRSQTPEDAKQLHLILIALTITGIVMVSGCTAFIAWYTKRKVTQPLAALSGFMQQFTRGERELSSRLELTKSDEIAAVVEGFHLLLGNLRETTTDVCQAAQKVTTIAQQVLAAAKFMFPDAAAQAASLVNITEMANAISHTIKENQTFVAEQTTLAQEISEYTATIETSIQKNTSDADQQLQRARNIREVVKKLSDTSKQVSQHALTAASLASETAAAVNQMSHAAHEISNTTSTQVDSTKKATELVTSMAQISSQARAKAHETVKLAEEAMEAASNGQNSVNQTVAGMRAITESSEQISDIIEVISDIAEQTDLLALNAAIEAARAGKHGLGFGVVADEIRKLAERVGHSSKEITRLIHDSNKRVNQGAVLVQDAYVALETISRNVSRTVEHIKELTAANEGQEIQSEIVAQTITTVEELAVVIERATRQQVIAVEEILKTMENLAALADDITARTETQVRDGEHIDTIMAELTDLSARIHAATIEQLSGTTQAFQRVENIAEKAQQIVTKTALQHERSQQMFAELHAIETVTNRNVQSLQEVQQHVQELIASAETFQHAVQRLTR